MFRTSSIFSKISFAFAAIVVGLSAQAARADAPKLGIIDRPIWDGGMKVVRVFAGSPADDMGLLPGDVIISVNGYLVSDYGDIARALYGSDYARVIWISYGQYFEGYAPLFTPVEEMAYRSGRGSPRHEMMHKKVMRRIAIKKPH